MKIENGKEKLIIDLLANDYTKGYYPIVRKSNSQSVEPGNSAYSCNCVQNTQLEI
jgi:hypothetical protein